MENNDILDLKDEEISNIFTELSAEDLDELVNTLLEEGDSND